MAIFDSLKKKPFEEKPFTKMSFLIVEIGRKWVKIGQKLVKIGQK